MSSIDKPNHPQNVHRETENIILLARDLATRSPEWLSRPTEIEFSFNNLCNLKCIMCSKADGEPNHVMDKALGLKFLEQVLPDALHLTPAANSEPLLNDLDLITEQCLKHDVMLFLFTNGVLCTEERFRKIRPVVHRLWFSFDSHVKETYERIRVGADYDTVVANIRRTVELAREDGTEITFHFVLMAMNARELPDYVRFVAELGGQEIKVQQLLENSRAYHDLKVEGQIPDDEMLAIRDRALASANEHGVDLYLGLVPPFNGEVRCRPMQIESKAPMAAFREVYMESFQKIYPGFCGMAMNYLKVTPEGDVFPCCRAPDVLKMGRIQDASFEAIWNGPAYRKFRHRMFDGDYPEVCRTCSVLTGNPHFKG